MQSVNTQLHPRGSQKMVFLSQSNRN